MPTIARALAALLLASTAATAFAETLVDNANGMQVDASGKLQQFDGLLIGDDGRVVKLLRKGETRPPAETRWMWVAEPCSQA